MAFRGGGGGGRQTCRFFLEGRCKFGDDCKFEHPRSQSSQSQNTNRFGALQSGNAGGSGARGGDRYRPGDNRNALPFGLNRDHIRWDVTSGERDGERPLWPMSCYAPGRDTPRQLIEGPEYEMSPEEVRVLFYLARASGDPAQLQQYEHNERATAAKADQAAQEIKNDPDRFIRLIIDAEKQHPNRIDQTVKNAEPWRRPAASFSAAPGTTSSFGMQRTAQPAFGAPSAPGARPSTFGAPSGLGGSNAGAPAFGAPSVLGGGSTPFGGQTQASPSAGFGAPSQLGSRPSPFAQQSAQPSPAFGQPSSGFGQPSAQPSSGFGQPSTQPSSGFGQPSALGGAASKTSPFASTPQPTASQPSGFASGGFSSHNNASPFAQGNAQPSGQNQNPFGVSASQPPPSSGFGQPSSAQAGTFGAPTNAHSTTNTFGQNGPPASTNPFGASQPASNPSPFARPNGAPAASNPFSSSQSGPGGGASGGFGTPSLSQAQAPSSSAATHHPNGTLQSWKGEPVTWKRPSGTSREPPVPTVFNRQHRKPERIWFPNGPPQVVNVDAEGVAAAYEGEIGAQLKQIYEAAQDVGVFQDGIMPEVPPKREWIRWDV